MNELKFKLLTREKHCLYYGTNVAAVSVFTAGVKNGFGKAHAGEGEVRGEGETGIPLGTFSKEPSESRCCCCISNFRSAAAAALNELKH